MNSKEDPYDGPGWLSGGYEFAEPLKKSIAAGENANKQLMMPEDTWLAFNKYGQVQVRHHLTKRVTGTERGLLPDKDAILIPKGTEIIFYADPALATAGISVATFYLDGEQVTYKKSQNLRRVRV